MNTIRVYAPIDNKAVLDEIHAAGLMLIVGIGYNRAGNYEALSNAAELIHQNDPSHPVARGHTL